MKDGALPVVIDVVADILGLDPSEVAAGSDLSDLGADQHDMTEIVSDLEFRLKIELPTDLEDARTVADLAAGVRVARQSWADFPPDGVR